MDLDRAVIGNRIFENYKCNAGSARCFLKMNGDDTGDNISDLAKYFSELSVQYWAWKNADVNYYGLCHYRRYLSFSNKKFDQCSRGYIIENMLNEESIEKYGLNDYDNMAKQIKKYDLITGGSMDVDEMDFLFGGKRAHCIKDIFMIQEHLFDKSAPELTLKLVDELYEKINYYALKASCALAKEKGAYSLFKGSDYDSGEYFEKRRYSDQKWKALREDIQRFGLRNGYIMAVAPTSSTSIIAGTTAAVDPVLKKTFIEEKKGSMIIRVAPDLNMNTFWLYKDAHRIDQTWIVKAAGIRQRHIDQAQSVNLYINNEYTFRKLLNLYIEAWKSGVKTLYYVRSQSLEVEECESCSA